MISVREIAWLAGLYEGEGYIGLSQGDRPAIYLTSVDEDVINRIFSTFKIGRIFRYRLPSGKKAHRFCVNKTPDAVGLALTLYSFLGKRRREQIDTAIARWKARIAGGKYQTRCKRGHDMLSEDNLLRSGDRKRCKTCHSMAREKYLATDKGRATTARNESARRPRRRSVSNGIFAL